MKNIFFLVLFFCHFGLNCLGNNRKVDLAFQSDTAGKVIPIDELTLGVLSLIGSDSGTIVIYNSHFKVWGTIDLAGKLSNDIHPYSVSLEHQHLVFRVIGQLQSYYKIIVNENSGLIRYIKKQDDQFRFQTWEQHIVKVLAIDFDLKKNPVRVSNNSSSKRKVYENEGSYYPVELRGDWLKINWDAQTKDQEGWIRWRAGKKLLINLYYVD